MTVEDALHHVYDDPFATDYSEFSSLARYALCWMYRDPMTASHAGRRVLDVGSGLGGFAAFSIKNAYPLNEYLGYEIRSEIRQSASRRKWPRTVTFTDKLPVQKKFDMVLCLGTVSYCLPQFSDGGLHLYHELLGTVANLLESSNSRMFFTLRTAAGRHDAQGNEYLVPDLNDLLLFTRCELVHRILLTKSEELFIVNRSPIELSPVEANLNGSD